VTATIPIPLAALSGEPWVVSVSSGAQTAVSPRFTVTAGNPNAPAPSTCGPVYTVQPGDWLSRIARECNTTVDAIVAANPSLENPSLIYPGRQLVMPGHQIANPEPQVIVDRVSAAPGTTLRVYAAGLPANREMVLGLGIAQQPPYFTTSATTNANGELSIGLTLPPEAQPGQRWVAFVRESANETILSAPVTVAAGGAAQATPLFNLRLREGPSVATARLDVVPAGVTLDVRATTADGWLQVEYRGQIGWIAGWLAELSGPPLSPNAPEPTPASPNP
jgi:LysM repeat protein